MIVLLIGLPGAGKTWLANQLENYLDCTILNRDHIRDAIFPEKELDFSDPQNELASQVTNMVAEYILQRNSDYLLFLDGRPFSKQYQIEEVRNLAAHVGHKIKGIYCWAPDEIVANRLEKDQKESNYDSKNRTMKKYYRIRENFDEILIDHIRINTHESLMENLSKIISFLELDEELINHKNLLH